MFAVEKKAVSGVVGYRELCIFALSFYKRYTPPRSLARLPAPAGFFLWWFAFLFAHTLFFFCKITFCANLKRLFFGKISTTKV